MDSNMEKWAHWTRPEGARTAQQLIDANLPWFKAIGILTAVVYIHLYSVYRWVVEMELRDDDE